MMVCLPRNSNLKICLNGNGKAISTSLSEIGLLHRPQQKQFGCQFFPKQLRNCPYPRGWLQPAQFELTHCKTNTKYHVSFLSAQIGTNHHQQQKQCGCQFFPKHLRNCPYRGALIMGKKSVQNQWTLLLNMLTRFLILENLPTYIADLEDIL